MGKDLKGKELGVGLSQRKDGLYTARFTNRYGRTVQKYFKKISECRRWYAEQKYKNEHGEIRAGENMTVDAWFTYWIDNVKADSIKPNTVTMYRNRYVHNIKPCIGNMLISDVKPMHCQNALNQMREKYSRSSIGLARSTMKNLFESAVENDIIRKNPVISSVRYNFGRTPKEVRAFTVEEQKRFMQASKHMEYYNQFAIILQTGLRTGEMTGLRWCDVDFDKMVMHISRNTYYDGGSKSWITGTTKSSSGNRDVYLTAEAIRILRNQERKRNRTKIVNMEFNDLVFVGRDGKPIKNNSYDASIKRICKKANIDDIFSMHALRHTFATRCAEAVMQPKTLQMILGHKDISTTMNLYVHVTEKEKISAMEKVAKSLAIG
jgi:integrase